MIELLNAIADKWFDWELAIAWQAAVLIAIVWVIDLVIRKWAWPQVRYALWMLVLVKLILPPTLTSPASFTAEIPILVQKAAQIRIAQPQATPKIIEVSRPAASYTEALADSLPATLTAPSTSTLTVPAAVSLSWKAYAFFVWLLGIVILSAWLIARLTGLRREHLKGDWRADLPEEFEELLASTAERLNLKRAPRVILTDKVCCPAVFGIFRPVLLMPAGKLENLSMADTEHILLHELAHIKRGDLVIHAIYMILQIVYWFNPLLWMMRKQLQNLRELCCDATVARLLREKTFQYRETLLETARQLLAEPVDPGLGLLGLFENSNWLLERLKWLEKKTWKNRKLRILTIFVLVCVMSATVIPMAKFDPGPPGLTIKGRVTDATTGEPIAGARIFDDPYGPGPDWQKIKSGFYEPDRPQWGAITDANGEYAFLTWHEHHSFKVEADGYKDEGGTLYGGHFTIPTKDIEIFDFALTPEKVDAEVEGEKSKKEELRAAIVDGDIDEVKKLIEEGADVNAKYEIGRIPLHFVKSKAVAELLIAKGAYVNARTKGGTTLLHTMAWNGNKEIVEFLLENGADVNAKHKKNHTPLHFAVRTGKKEVVKLLLTNGALVNAKDEWGYTPLHWANKEGYRNIAELLLANGADASAEDKKGLTPLDYTSKANLQEVMDVPVLIDALDNKDLKVRATARNNLRNIGKPAIAALVEALKDKKLDVRMGAAMTLGMMGPEAKDAAGALADALKGDDKFLRSYAGYSLMQIDEPPFPIIMELLKDEEPFVRRAIVEHLGDIGSEAVTLLIQALKDKDSLVRNYACWGLGNIGPKAKDAIGPLTLATQDNDKNVRHQATEALKKIKPIGSKSQFAATLQNGVTVELVGICKYPSMEGGFWRADGGILKDSYLEKVPPLPTAISDGTERLRMFLRHYGGTDTEIVTWKFDEIHIRYPGPGHYIYGPENDSAKWYSVLSSFPIQNDYNSSTLSFAIAQGQYKGKWRGYSGETPKGSYVIGQPSKLSNKFVKNKTAIALSHNLSDVQYRLMAKDKNDKWHTGKSALRSVSGGLIQETYVFEEIEPEEVETPTLQTRPYQWVTFEDVSLKPDFKMDAQIVKLLDTLRTGKGRQRKRASEKLAKYGRAVVPPITEMLQDDNVWAAHALQLIGPKAGDAVPALIESLTKGGVGGIRTFSASALGQIGPAAVPAIPALIGTLKDQHGNTRMQAAAALGYLSTGEKDVIEALTAALEDEDETVRKEAARALKRIGVEKTDAEVEGGR